MAQGYLAKRLHISGEIRDKSSINGVILRVLCTVVYSFFTFLSVCSLVEASSAINCSYEANDQIKLEKENLSVVCQWRDTNDRLNYLVQRKLDKKARTQSLRIFNSQESYIEKPIELETSTHIEERDDEYFLVKYDIRNGKRKLAKIDNNSDWANNISWFIDPKLTTDPDRKLLKLKTHDGHDFYSFYYLPSNFHPSDNQKIVILLQGGTGSYKHEPDREEFLDVDTVKFIRDAGYLPLLANFRGKQRLSNSFRSTGPGKMHSYGIKDIVTALDALRKNVSFDESDIRIIGHSRGGHMAALLATRLSDVTNKYKISKTVVSSGVFNPIDGYYSYYKDLQDIIEKDKNLDFVDDDWTNGPLAFRPNGKFTDSQWDQIQKIEKEHFQKFFMRSYDKVMPLSQKQVYFEQSPYHHSYKLQGQVLALTGISETHGNTSIHAPLQFQEKVGDNRVTVKFHEWGHGFPNSSDLDYSPNNEQIKRGINCKLGVWHN